MKRFLKDYFRFSRKERRALFFLVALIVVFLAAPYLYPGKKTEFTRTAGIPQEKNIPDSVRGDLPIRNENSTVLFAFDPNLAGEETWRRLGVREKTIQTILRYRSKGGRFREPADLRKIWGMSTADADRLMPYVHIPETSASQKIKKIEPRQKSMTVSPIDINRAEVAEWRSLPGIGDVLAARIVSYREKIGGFTGVEQIAKVYGIKDSIYQLIKPLLFADPAAIPLLPLNRAPAWQMTNRLSISPAQARAIVAYREINGPFTAVTDLKKIVFLQDSVYRRIAPLVSVD